MIFKDKDKDKIKEKATQPIFLEDQPERSFSTLQVRTAIEGCADECLSFEPVENRTLLSAFGYKIYFCKYTKGCEHALKCSKEQPEEARCAESEE